MQELPEDLLTTDKLLYFRLDGESQATLVKIAEEMLDEEP